MQKYNYFAGGSRNFGVHPHSAAAPRAGNKMHANIINLVREASPSKKYWNTANN
jgi:hypothetical protein